jgi:FAD/FMN-containing dehydrogenase
LLTGLELISAHVKGFYGLVADNILSAKMVLANGTLINVSATENPDLYWAIRGAGHNFGVVVEFQLKIYDKQEADMWINAEYFYEDDQLEDVFTFLNEYREVQPKEMTVFAGFSRTGIAADVSTGLPYPCLRSTPGWLYS